MNPHLNICLNICFLGLFIILIFAIFYIMSGNKLNF